MIAGLIARLGLGLSVSLPCAAVPLTAPAQDLGTTVLSATAQTAETENADAMGRLLEAYGAYQASLDGGQAFSRETLLAAEDALAAGQRIFPEDDPQLGWLYSNLGITLVETNRPRMALDPLENGLKILIPALGADSQELFVTWIAMAAAYRSAGQAESAVRAAAQALVIAGQTPQDRTRLGEAHLALGRSYFTEFDIRSRRGGRWVYVKQQPWPFDPVIGADAPAGRANLAADKVSEEFENARSVYGPGSLGEYFVAGEVIAMAKPDRQMLEATEQILMVLEQALPAAHPEVLKAYGRLIRIHRKRDNRREVAALQEKLRSLRESAGLGQPSPDETDTAERPQLSRPGKVQYPQGAAQAGVCGWTLLDFTITPEGKAADIEIADSNPAGIFDDAALRSMKGFRFTHSPDDTSYEHYLYQFVFELDGSPECWDF